MLNRQAAVLLGVACVGWGLSGMGCSTMSAVTTGGRMALNLGRNKSYLRITLDAHEAKQNTLKKAVKGYSEWKIKDEVSTTPKFKYTMKDPEHFGRITMTAISIFQEFKGRFSHQPEFTIVPRDNAADHMIQHDEEYDLGHPPEYLKVVDVRADEVEGVKLIPGMKYQIQFTVRGDRSETAIVEFDTK